MSDTSSPEWKTLRFVFAECALYIGGPLGLTLGGMELDYLGFRWVFVISTSLGAACVMYSLSFLRNDTHTRSDAYQNLLDHESDEIPDDSISITYFLRYMKARKYKKSMYPSK